MKKLFLVLAVVSAPASAATLFVQWTDPLPAGPAYVPSYAAEYRVNGGTATAVNNLSAPTLTQTITATAGQTVEVRYRADNIVVPDYPVSGPGTAWYPASQASTPPTQASPTVTVFTY